MAPSKPKTLTVQLSAQIEIDYSDADLEAMDKTFREFKAGVERTIKGDLLPAFSADPHTRITLGTLAFPTTRKLLKKQKEAGKYRLEN